MARLITKSQWSNEKLTDTNPMFITRIPPQI